MSVEFDYADKEAHDCVAELAYEYLNVGAAKCNSMKDETQLCAFLMLGVRSISLLGGLFLLLNRDTIDTHEIVRRAYWETYTLQFEFRLKKSEQRTGDWFSNEADAWKAKKKVIQQYFEKPSGSNRGIGFLYGALTGVAHPTKDAANNSVASVSISFGLNPNVGNLMRQLGDYRTDWAGMFSSVVALSVDSEPHYIESHISAERIPKSLQFRMRFNSYLKQNPSWLRS